MIQVEYTVAEILAERYREEGGWKCRVISMDDCDEGEVYYLEFTP